LAEQHTAELESARKKPHVVEISHPADGDAKHHHGVKLFCYNRLTTIGSQVRSRKLENGGKIDVFGGRSDGVPKTDVHLNLDSGLLQVSRQFDPYAAILAILADLFPFDGPGRKPKAVRRDGNGTNLSKDLFEPRDTGFTTSQQVEITRRSIRSPAPQDEKGRSLQKELA